jgi:DNA-binding LytR/AlgR family response regulator
LSKEALTLIRIAVATVEQQVTDRIKQQLIEYAVQNDCEIDIAEIGDNFSALESRIKNLDLAIMDYKFLNRNKASLAKLYKHNPDCLSIPLGMPEGIICAYLALRPGGHLRSADEKLELYRICNICAKQLNEDHKVLQFATKKGLYAISLRSILYCQSDLKYITLITDDGMKCSKLGKLDDLSDKLPRNFVRVHQSFIVNFQQVCGMDKSSHELLLNGDIRIPFSRAYQTFVMQLFQNGIFGV